MVVIHQGRPWPLSLGSSLHASANCKVYKFFLSFMIFRYKLGLIPNIHFYYGSFYIEVT